jgi:predicted nucleic acid-binding protein
MKIVVNSSPLIALGYIDKIGLLKDLFEEVFIPEEVYKETVINGKNNLVEEGILKYGLKVITVKHTVTVDFLEEYLDKGEAEVIALAEEMLLNNVMIDELKGRHIAERHGFNVIGSSGVLLLAKKKGLISNVRENIEIMQANDIRISEKLKTVILKEAGEL